MAKDRQKILVTKLVMVRTARRDPLPSLTLAASHIGLLPATGSAVPVIAVKSKGEYTQAETQPPGSRVEAWHNCWSRFEKWDTIVPQESCGQVGALLRGVTGQAYSARSCCVSTCLFCHPFNKPLSRIPISSTRRTRRRLFQGAKNKGREEHWS